MLYSSANIPYQEYRAISELMSAHPQALNGSLKALIAFGEIVATGESHDINLLEVVAGWKGPRHTSYGNTAALPLRGRLHLYFLTPEEFEHPTDTASASEPMSSLELLTRMQQAYAILLEEPNDYAHQVMSQVENFPALRAADADSIDSDPVSFLQRQTVTQVSA
jgi:hypothetical protein